MDIPAPSSTQKAVEGAAEEVGAPQIERLRTDKSQATIANFLKRSPVEDIEETEE
jgi:hypothetical protein